MGNQSYEYAMGRVRAVERRMLDRARLERMIEAGSAEDALHVLREAEYGGAFANSVTDAREYESMLEAEGAKLAAFISEISPEPGLLNIFLLRFDYHNIKVLLKSEFAGKTGGGQLSSSGIVPPAKLAQTVRERTFSDLPAEMAAGTARAIQDFRQSVSARAPDPQIIDIRLDQAMYAQMRREARDLRNPFIERLICIYIDVANIGAFLRMRHMGKNVDFLLDALIPGGAIERSLLARCAQDGLDAFIGAMQYTQYAVLCETGVKDFQATGLMTVFERCADDYINTYIKKAKLFSAGLEIIAAYFVARQTEMKNVRIAMVGKINGIAQDVIRERLRECFV